MKWSMLFLLVIISHLSANKSSTRAIQNGTWQVIAIPEVEFVSDKFVEMRGAEDINDVKESLLSDARSDMLDELFQLSFSDSALSLKKGNINKAFNIPVIFSENPEQYLYKESGLAYRPISVIKDTAKVALMQFKNRDLFISIPLIMVRVPGSSNEEKLYIEKLKSEGKGHLLASLQDKMWSFTKINITDVKLTEKSSENIKQITLDLQKKTAPEMINNMWMTIMQKSFIEARQGQYHHTVDTQTAVSEYTEGIYQVTNKDNDTLTIIPQKITDNSATILLTQTFSNGSSFSAEAEMELVKSLNGKNIKQKLGNRDALSSWIDSLNAVPLTFKAPQNAELITVNAPKSSVIAYSTASAREFPVIIQNDTVIGLSQEYNTTLSLQRQAEKYVKSYTKFNPNEESAAILFIDNNAEMSTVFNTIKILNQAGIMKFCFIAETKTEFTLPAAPNKPFFNYIKTILDNVPAAQTLQAYAHYFAGEIEGYASLCKLFDQSANVSGAYRDSFFAENMVNAAEKSSYMNIDNIATVYLAGFTARKRPYAIRLLSVSSKGYKISQQGIWKDIGPKLFATKENAISLNN